MDKYHCWSTYIFGPLLFSIFKNDLSESFSTNAKLFADNTSLLSIINDLSEGLSTNATLFADNTSLLSVINDLPEGPSTIAKLFADNTPLFSGIHNSHTFANDLNKDLDMIHNWTFQWEINFNTDPTKQAGKSIFSRKTEETISCSLCF